MLSHVTFSVFVYALRRKVSETAPKTIWDSPIRTGAYILLQSLSGTLISTRWQRHPGFHHYTVLPIIPFQQRLVGCFQSTLKVTADDADYDLFQIANSGKLQPQSSLVQNISMATNQESIMPIISLDIKMEWNWERLRKPTSHEFQAFNRSKTNFGEIHVSQGQVSGGFPLYCSIILS